MLCERPFTESSGKYKLIHSDRNRSGCLGGVWRKDKKEKLQRDTRRPCDVINMFTSLMGLMNSWVYVSKCIKLYL